MAPLSQGLYFYHVKDSVVGFFLSILWDILEKLSYIATEMILKTLQNSSLVDFNV